MGSLRRPDVAPEPPYPWIVAGGPNRAPELIQLVDVWCTLPTMWRIRILRFAADGDDGGWLVPLWGLDEHGMRCVVHMVLIWSSTSSGTECPLITNI